MAAVVGGAVVGAGVVGGDVVGGAVVGASVLAGAVVGFIGALRTVGAVVAAAVVVGGRVVAAFEAALEAVVGPIEVCTAVPAVVADDGAVVVVAPDGVFAWATTQTPPSP